jgi:hypothetical protein
VGDIGRGTGRDTLDVDGQGYSAVEYSFIPGYDRGAGYQVKQSSLTLIIELIDWRWLRN